LEAYFLCHSAFLQSSLASPLFLQEKAISLEQPEYTVIYKDGDVEYCRYEPYLVAEPIIMKTALSNRQSANRTRAMNISQAK